MTDKTEIRIIIADEAARTRDSLREMINQYNGMVVVGECADSTSVVEASRKLQPDIVLLDIGIGNGDGLYSAGEITRTMASEVILMTSDSDREQFRKAMQAGARDCLVKPISPDDLVSAIENVARMKVITALYSRETSNQGPGGKKKKGKVFTVFATKGGVGKSTLATNLAAALSLVSSSPTALADMDLEFGCQPAMLGLKSKASIVDVCLAARGALGILDLERALLPGAGKNRIMLLPPPPSPELAAVVVGEGRPDPNRNYVGEVIDVLSGAFDQVVLDTASNFHETNITCLDKSDMILVVTTPDIPALQNTAKCLDVLLEKLGYSEEVVKLVLNRCDGTAGLSQKDISSGLNYNISFRIPSDGPTAVWAANFGQPFVLKRGRLPIAKSVLDIAKALSESSGSKDA